MLSVNCSVLRAVPRSASLRAPWSTPCGKPKSATYKAIYVFEVQSRGSIDSLILNLKKAQNNAAVQAVVAVADEEQLARIIKESRGVIDEEDLRTWDSEDVLAVYDALVRAHESINKLALVPESF